MDNQRTSVLDRNLYLIVESEFDGSIIRTLLDCNGFKNVYTVPAGGYRNIPSLIRTLRLMCNKNDVIIGICDADSEKEEDIAERLSSMKILSKADVSEVKIEIFCFVPTLDILFKDYTGYRKNKIDAGLIDYMKSNYDILINNNTIADIRDFLSMYNQN